ncbi:MAG: hypothetical protein ACRDCJ_02125 [Metamycoplasmataceae bacterium]
MNDEIKRINKRLIVILTIGIFSFLCGITFLILGAIANNLAHSGEHELSLFIDHYIMTPFIILWLAPPIPTALYILASNFKIKESNDSKIFWGLLSLFLLGSIGLIIFSIINIIKIKKIQSMKTNANDEINSTSYIKTETEIE